MIVKSQKIKCSGKEILEGITKEGKQYTNKCVYFEDVDGSIITISFCNDLVYNKAQKDKMYTLNLYIPPRGKIEVNNLGE